MGSLSRSYEGKGSTLFLRGEEGSDRQARSSTPIAQSLRSDAATGRPELMRNSRANAAYTSGWNWSPDAASLAKAAIDRVYNANIENFDIPEPPGSFDVLIAGEVLEHLVDPWSVLKRLRHFLRPGRGGDGQFAKRGALFDDPHASQGRMDARRQRTHGSDPSSLVYAQVLCRDVPGLRFRGHIDRAALRIRAAGKAGQQAYRRPPRAPVYWTDRRRREECRILKKRRNGGRMRGLAMILAASLTR